MEPDKTAVARELLEMMFYIGSAPRMDLSLMRTLDKGQPYP
jgi:hypothetical protein